ncbi:MAG TPA: hypothetical protein DIC52_22550, partial [Candidatus Latescibacteria bacterium]|nr:hypothetical protein [Candidatus Latescibacterota bacterium]
MTGALDDLAPIGSNLQALTDSGLINLATLVSNIDFRTLAISNLLGDLDVLDLLTGALDELAPLGSNLQALIDSGLVDVISLVSNIDFRTLAISNLLGDLDVLDLLTGSLDELAPLGSNLQALIDSGLVDVISLVSNIDFRTLAISNLLGDLDVLDLLTGSLDELAPLGSNLQALIDSGLVDIASMVSNIDFRTLAMSNLLGDLDVLDLLTGSLDELAPLGSNLQALIDSGLVDIASMVSNIDLRTLSISNLLGDLDVL